MYFVSISWHLKYFTDSSNKTSVIKGQISKHRLTIFSSVPWEVDRSYYCLAQGVPALFTADGIFTGLFGWSYYAFQKPPPSVKTLCACKDVNNHVEKLETDLNHKYPDA